MVDLAIDPAISCGHCRALLPNSFCIKKKEYVRTPTLTTCEPSVRDIIPILEAVTV